MAYSTISKQTTYFTPLTFTGNGGTNAVTGVGHQPDLVWIKNRSTSDSHSLYDAVRGVTKRLKSDANGAETTQSNGLTAFGTDGFTVGDHGGVNGNGNNIISWNWRAGNSAGAANNDGSTETTVTANTTAGFSIVKYNGSNSVQTFGHGLGAVPQWIIVKNLTAGYEWAVYHHSMGNTKYLNLDTNSAELDDTVWNDTTPTSSVFTCGAQKIYTNYSGQSYIAYCFTPIPGFSAFGKYDSNNSTNGPFVYTGFKPNFLMIKSKGSGGYNWMMFDSSRQHYNLQGVTVQADTSDAEFNYSPNGYVDLLSNGFKLRSTSNGVNGSGASEYLYMAFGQTLVGSNNIPATAR